MDEPSKTNDTMKSVRVGDDYSHFDEGEDILQENGSIVIGDTCIKYGDFVIGDKDFVSVVDFDDNLDKYTFSPSRSYRYWYHPRASAFLPNYQDYVPVDSQIREGKGVIVEERTNTAEQFTYIVEQLEQLKNKMDVHDDTTDKKLEELKELIITGNLTIVDCFKLNAIRNIQLTSLFFLFTMLFSLVISMVLGVHLINPFFALLLLIATLGYFIMTKVEEAIRKRKQL